VIQKDLDFEFKRQFQVLSYLPTYLETMLILSDTERAAEKSRICNEINEIASE